MAHPPLNPLGYTRHQLDYMALALMPLCLQSSSFMGVPGNEQGSVLQIASKGSASDKKMF
jgi:hypothetical protein